MPPEQTNNTEQSVRLNWKYDWFLMIPLWFRFVRAHCDHLVLQIIIHTLALICVGTIPLVWVVGNINIEDADAVTKSKGMFHVLFKGTTPIDVFLALCGILVGVLVTVVVERRNSITQEALTETTKKISVNVGNIIKFSVISEYRIILEKIKAITEHAEKNGHDLFIMNPTASFGFFLTFDADVVIGASQPSNETKEAQRLRMLDSMSMHTYFQQWEKLEKLKNENSEQLKALAKAGKTKVYYATLSPEPYHEITDEPGESRLVSPYRLDFAEPGTMGENVNVRFYDYSVERAHEKFNVSDLAGTKLFLISRDTLNNRKFQNYYKFVAPTENNDLAVNRETFIQFLEANQKQRVEDLSKRGVEVKFRLLKNVPLQLFLSYPKKPSTIGPENDAQCLVMFSNQYTIGQINNIAAFSTEDWNIISVFRTMWNVIVNREGIDGENKQSIPTIERN